jgi:hypothetical protein
MNSLNILGKTFKLEWLDELPDALGETYTSKQLIRMQKGLPADTERETLLHEVIHAVEESLALGLTEAQVHALACGLFAVLRDNHQPLKRYYGSTGTPRRKTRSKSG